MPSGSRKCRTGGLRAGVARVSDEGKTFVESDLAGKRKQARKALFLIEMDQVAPSTGLLALIERHSVFST